MHKDLSNCQVYVNQNILLDLASMGKYVVSVKNLLNQTTFPPCSCAKSRDSDWFIRATRTSRTRHGIAPWFAHTKKCPIRISQYAEYFDYFESNIAFEWSGPYVETDNQMKLFNILLFFFLTTLHLCFSAVKDIMNFKSNSSAKTY